MCVCVCAHEFGGGKGVSDVCFISTRSREGESGGKYKGCHLSLTLNPSENSTQASHKAPCSSNTTCVCVCVQTESVHDAINVHMAW